MLNSDQPFTLSWKEIVEVYEYLDLHFTYNNRNEENIILATFYDRCKEAIQPRDGSENE